MSRMGAGRQHEIGARGGGLVLRHRSRRDASLPNHGIGRRLVTDEELDAAIAKLEADGWRVIAPPTPDDDLKSNWDQLLAVLRMSEDMSKDGAVLRIETSLNLADPQDARWLMRNGVMRMIDNILETAVVKRKDQC